MTSHVAPLQIDRELNGRQPVVFLDYDGTLTPIVTDPADAVLSDAMRREIAALAEVRSVAIVSGRDLDDVRQRVGLDKVVYAGSHGFDIVGPNGLRRQHERGRDALPALETATDQLQAALTDVQGAQIERKRFAIAAHYRQCTEEGAQQVQQAVRHLAERDDRLRMTTGKKVVELRPNTDWDKGRALLWLLRTLGLDDESHVPIYLGDDDTDEDAFCAIQDRGIGILVGPKRDTAAKHRIDEVEDVQRVLSELREAAAA